MNEQILETDQWKFNGNCNKCRRQNYCSKCCSAFNKQVRKNLSEKLNNIPCIKILNKVVKEDFYDKY